MVTRRKEPETTCAPSGLDESDEDEDDSDEDGSNEEVEFHKRPFLPSLARMGLIPSYVRECVEDSKTAMYEVFRRWFLICLKRILPIHSTYLWRVADGGANKLYTN